MSVPFLVSATPATSVAPASPFSTTTFGNENMVAPADDTLANEWAAMLAAMLGMALPQTVPVPVSTAQIDADITTETIVVTPQHVSGENNNCSFLTAYISQTVPANNSGKELPAHKQVTQADVPHMLAGALPEQATPAPLLTSTVVTPPLDGRAVVASIASEHAHVHDLPLVHTVGQPVTRPTLPANASAAAVSAVAKHNVVVNEGTPATATEAIVTEVAPLIAGNTEMVLPLDSEVQSTDAIELALQADAIEEPVATTEEPLTQETPEVVTDRIQKKVAANTNASEHAIQNATQKTVEVSVPEQASEHMNVANTPSPVVVKIVDPKDKEIKVASAAFKIGLSIGQEAEDGLINSMNGEKMRGIPSPNASQTAHEAVAEARARHTTDMGADIEIDIPEGQSIMTSALWTTDDMLPALTSVAHSAAAAAASPVTTALNNAHAMPVTTQMAAAIHQLAQSDVKTNTNGEKSITVQLDPPDLGRIHVQLRQDASEKLHVHLIAERPETLALLQRDAQFLEMALGKHGLSANAGNLEFSLGNNGSLFHGGSDDGRNQRSAHKTASVEAGLAVESRPDVYIDPITGLPRYDLLV
ncbi:MAG: hypothetical protein GC136_06970 [Alphaproteobacteria bacterium]|nr:hypothetical protein [Alphaproteobacteria bacterium]